MIEPIRLAFSVACAPARAFACWTDLATLWWPGDHTASGLPGTRVIFEAGAGGRIYERTPTGEEIDWGQIVIWEPPQRLVYQWHLRADRADATEVEVTFGGQADGMTRVAIEHRGWERLGAAGPTRRDGNRQGWAGFLPHYVAACGNPTLGA